MRETLYIRTDANPVLGIGHVMRCCTIAQAWKKLGGAVVFLVSDIDSQQVVQEQGFPAICLTNSAWNDLEIELEEIKERIIQEGITILLIDSYYVTRDYMEELYARVKVIYFGKFHKQAFPAHMVIDYTIQTMDCSDEYDCYNIIGTKKLLGCSYYPLRSEFLENAVKYDKKNKEGKKDILITTGGSDPFCVALELGRCLALQEQFRLHIVMGKFNKNRKELTELSVNCPNLFVYDNIRNMGEIMRMCDFAVSAGGITLYELCACGVPSIVYTFADNQILAAETFAKHKIMISIGDIRGRETEQWVNQIKNQLIFLSENPKKGCDMSQKMLQLVDGRGSERIVHEISKMR